MRRRSDGPAGDFDYEAGGAGYADHRRPDPRIAALVHEALGDARTVVNVGAGAGSYEPDDRHVTPVEPSARMRAQRPRHRAPAVDATAEALPFDDDAFDAAMATVTVHQWGDQERGLAELRRVTRGPVVVLTFDPAAIADFWLAAYVPELVEAEVPRFPGIAWLGERIGGGGRWSATTVPIPIDCTDGFTEAFYARPERFLDEPVRRAQSAWAFVDPSVEARFVEQLTADLADGTWDAAHGHLR
ncbi:MAG TPA: methyltransferase domain-containing protein, partial [Acidimicrobiales bacterium]